MMSGIFGKSADLKLPEIHGIAIEERIDGSQSSVPSLISGEVELCGHAAYLKAVTNVMDLDYFEDKRVQTELACAKWMDILSVNWDVWFNPIRPG